MVSNLKHLIRIIKVSFLPAYAQLNNLKSNLKLTLKLTLKSYNMFRCKHHLQGAHYLSLLKLQLLKSIKIHRCG